MGGTMKLEFHGDTVSIYMPLRERDKAIAFLNKYSIDYKEFEITQIDKQYIQFRFSASETINRLFNQFREELEK